MSNTFVLKPVAQGVKQCSILKIKIYEKNVKTSILMSMTLILCSVKSTAGFEPSSISNSAFEAGNTIPSAAALSYGDGCLEIFMALTDATFAWSQTEPGTRANEVAYAIMMAYEKHSLSL